jgi:NDP-sugar pyrophosphorylase family protein
MILGAGLATRFEPISGDTTGYPKPGVPLVGEDSVIVSIAKHLRRHGFTRILVNTFYKPDCLKQQLQAIPGIEVVFIDEAAPSGTAGGLAQALEQGKVDRNKPIFIIQGDAMTDADLSFLTNTHQSREAAVTIGGQIVSDEDVNKFGIIETDASGGDGQSGNITSFKEKPSLEEAGNSRFANSGFYLLSPEVLDLFLERWNAAKKNQALYDYAQDFFPAVLKAIQEERLTSRQTGRPMQFWAQALGGYWSDMGNPTQYVESVRDAYSGKLEIALPQNLTDYYENGIIYWPGAKALAEKEKAQLFGNIIVAKRCQV